MWTPKRILLLVGGFFFFFGCYQVYHFFLGRYDGLPPLPAEYRPRGDQQALGPVNLQPDLSYVADVKEAFGEKCEEVNRRVFHWKQQGLLIATDNWKLQPNGKLLFTKVSVALFPQGKADGLVREINTLKGDEAEIEFDKPIKDLKEIGQRKPIAGELRGNVHLKNNRKTPTAEDDIRLLTTWLKYRDDQHRIWTDAAVRMVDDGCGAMVTATGMDVELAATEPDPKAGAKAKPGPNLTGVRRVRLDHDVRMELPDDGRSNFLAAGKAKPAAAPAAGPNGAPAAQLAPPQKSLVIIESQGPFTFQVEQDRAEFTDKVKVLRKKELAKDDPAGAPAQFDQLDCEQLLLQFVRTKKAQADGKPRDPTRPPTDLAIAEARALGKVVELTSDGDGQAKNLHVTGVELHYDKAKGQTTLRGGPNLFVELSGYELRLQGLLVLIHDPSGEKPLQEARAIGSGEIRLLPQQGEGGPAKTPLFVRWRDQLTWGQDEGKDRLLFQGPTSFEDPQRGKLEANEQLAVWIETLAPVADASATPTAAEKAKPQGRKQPSRLVATGDVRLVARELFIRKTDRLSLAFVGEETAIAATGGSPLLGGPEPPPPGASSPLNFNSPTQGRPAIEITAGWIDARLQKAGGRYGLDRMRAEGAVHIVQPAAQPSDKPVDLRGERLDLTRVAEGLHKADLFGKPAVVQLDKLFLSGPEIKLDQQQNVVEVNGAGTMRVPTRSDFEGRPLAQETDLTLEWGTRMLFDGLTANFVGAVKAEQQQARLQAGKLTVELDRKYSLKKKPEGQAKEQPIALARLLGTDGVILERRGEKVGEFQRVKGRELDFNNQEKVLLVAGPGGQFDLLSTQTDQFGMAKPAAPGAPTNVPALKLTRVLFENRLEARQRDGSVHFTGETQLFYVPTNDVNIVLNPNHLPAEALFISSKELKGRAAAAGTGAQELKEMEAVGRVRTESREFLAQCDVLTYDVAKQLMTMEAMGLNQVVLTRLAQRGAAGNTMRSKKLIYDRTTGQIKNLGIEGIQIGPQK